MIRDIKRRTTVDARGKITSGIKNDKGYPQAVDYFVVSDFNELVRVYGPKPTKLILYFPSDDITSFYDCNYNSWGKGPSGPVKKRSCDGERCVHRIAEYGRQPGEEGECICKKMNLDEKSRCRYDCYFKAFVADPNTGRIENPACYFFETHSKNSGDAVYSELENIRALNMGGIRGIPFVISVKMASSANSATQKFPIWSMQAVGTLSKIAEISSKGGLFTPFNKPFNLGQPRIPEQKQIVAPSAEENYEVVSESDTIDQDRQRELNLEIGKSGVNIADFLAWLDIAFETKGISNIINRHYPDVLRAVKDDRAQIVALAKKARENAPEKAVKQDFVEADETPARPLPF